MKVEWVEGDIAGGKGAFGIVETGFTMALFRQRDGSVWFSAALPPSSLSLDRNRLPILWIDDTIVCDAGETAELSRTAEQNFDGADQNFLPYVMIDDSVVGFRLWQGDKQASGFGQLSGFFGGTKLTVRYFVRPYDSIDITVDLEGLRPLLRGTLGLPC